MTSTAPPTPPAAPLPPASPQGGAPEGPQSGWARFTAGAVRTFHTYGSWLAGITWTRFVMLSLLLIVVAAILSTLTASRSRIEIVSEDAVSTTPATPTTRTTPTTPTTPSAGRRSRADWDDATISIDGNGVRITPGRRHDRASDTAASAVREAASAASAAASAASSLDAVPDVDIKLPPGADSAAVREAVAEAKQAVLEAIRDAKEEASDAATDAAKSKDSAARIVRRIRHENEDPPFVQLALVFIIASAIMKISYTGTVKAESKAAVAAETAESEQLKRQVVEARMAALQAQVEPHFLFNTLASIDHLIETDPPRASQMQKNLIALLRASMPSLRESQPKTHNLGREMAVIRPYLEILKVRMEDRLQTRIDVPDGLLSAEFPPMMIQSLVENAIKHGLEPKAEGGELRVSAEIVHGKLAVTIADTGLGFGKAATAGTGVGLENIRERLKLIYGDAGAMTVADNAPSGTVVTLTVPYLHHADATAAPATPPRWSTA